MAKDNSLFPSDMAEEISGEEFSLDEKKPKKISRPRKAKVAKAEEKPKKATRTIKTEKAVKTVKTERREKKNLLFALDIGTRSVIGIVAEKTPDGMKIIATERQEHKTRAMLDGQIHDVLQVASIIKDVKKRLAEKVGTLSHAAVAAAGRALYTMNAEAEIEVSGIITAEQERGLDFAAVQIAQQKLAESDTIDDPTSYYCVGYSAMQYVLDDVPLKSLIGQRGHIAKSTVIATFLPRQVIDSIQSSLRESKLDMRAITLEPIAAINVLIPPTMRHLNLVLVDIGAGTSDVAITKNGSVIAYGMVPFAGDEITEAISQKFLLDFNVAEKIKRDAAGGFSCHFSDILGTTYDLKATEIIEPILPTIKNLATAISRQILSLNGSEPQAVLLVGGGALTPNLAQFVADELKLPAGRVAVRHPETIDGIDEIPDVLRSPDAVTPLGILKIASLDNLHFLTVFVNDNEYRLFNFRNLTISDALLNAGIRLKNFNGKPGLGAMLTVNGQAKFFPGTLGTLARLTLDGVEATLDTPIENGSHIKIENGTDGTPPEITLKDIYDDAPNNFVIYLNGEEHRLPNLITVNGENAALDKPLKDGDVVVEKKNRTVGEVILACGLPPTGPKVNYTLNGTSGQYTLSPTILLDDMPTVLSASVCEGDHLDYLAASEPRLSDILPISENDTHLTIYFNNAEYKIPSCAVTVMVNGRPAKANTIISDGSEITYRRDDNRTAIVSEAILAVGFEPPKSTSGVTVEISVNGKSAQFTDPIKNGDTLTIDIVPHGEEGLTKKPRQNLAFKPQENKKSPPPNSPPPSENKTATGKDGLLGDIISEKKDTSKEKDGLLDLLVIEEKPSPPPKPAAEKKTATGGGPISGMIRKTPRFLSQSKGAKD